MKAFKRWILYWGCFLALALVFLALHLKNPFYADDYYHLAFVKFMKDPARTIWHYNFGTVFWRPLMMSTDLLLLRWFGMSTEGWHVFDLLLHSLNALLVSVLAFRLFEGEDERWRKFCSLLAGVIFAVHPIALLTTAWIACRGDLMATFFSLLALLLLMSGIKTRKLIWLKLPLSVLLALTAFFSKESMMVLPGVALVLGFLFPARQPVLRRGLNAMTAFVPVLLALIIYLVIRLNVFGGFGGYETFEFQAGFIFPRLFYHVPRVLGASFRDYFLFHIAVSSVWSKLILGSYLAGFLIAALYLLRSPRTAVLGVIWVLISLVPLWNLSHMLSYGESRLLYFGLAGFAIAACSAVFAIENSKLRALILVPVLIALAALSANSWTELSQFKERCVRFQKVKEQVLLVVPRDESRSPISRIYIYGLGFDFYYLDMMLKMEKPEWINKIIVLADAPSLAWVKSSIIPLYSQGKLGLPSMEIHYTDRDTAAVTVTPPRDLIGSSVNDPQSLVLEWDKGLLREISPELLQLSRERRFLQATFTDQYRIRYLPTYSFRKRNYALDWKLSPGLNALTPDRLGDPYTLISKTNDPYIISTELSFMAIGVAELEFELRIMPKNFLAPQEKDGCFFWMTDRDKDWKPEQKICFPITADGKFHDYRIKLDQNLYWLRSPNIYKVRLDPIAFPGWFQLDTLKFSPIPAEEN